ncbi:MAG: ABC transporter ATP-binding protein [Thermomicrobiales bacterium]
MAAVQSEPLLEVKELKIAFDLAEGRVQAVDGVTFTVKQGETLGVVGESGCGKSITARSILRITGAADQNSSGEILYHRRIGAGSTGRTETIDLLKLDAGGRQIRGIRGAEIAMIFQEPMTAFSPVHTIGNQIVEAVRLHEPLSASAARTRAIEMLQLVEMPNAERRIDAYPHQLSGGMRQRAMIAMALVCQPRILLADEPTTALDVTTQAQILSLLRRLKEEFGMSVIMITHDLGVVAETARTVAVMYLGRVVEIADVRALFREPKHPYTQAMLNSIPRMGRRAHERLHPVKGMVPSPYNRPRGCPFHPRCPYMMPGICDRYEPRPTALEGGREVSCFLYGTPNEHESAP